MLGVEHRERMMRKCNTAVTATAPLTSKAVKPDLIHLASHVVAFEQCAQFLAPNSARVPQSTPFENQPETATCGRSNWPKRPDSRSEEILSSLLANGKPYLLLSRKKVARHEFRYRASPLQTSSSSSRANSARSWMKANRASARVPISRSTDFSASARSSGTSKTLSKVRLAGSMVVSLSCAGIISPSPLKRPVSTLALARNSRLENLFLVLVVTRIERFAAMREPVERWHRKVEMALFDQLRHLAIEEGDQERCDVGAVDIGVGHHDHLVVAQVLVAIMDAGPAAERLHEIGELLVLRKLALGGARHVQDLAAQRQHRLVRAITRLLRRAARKSPSTMKISAPAAAELLQSASFPGRRSLRVALLRATSFS